MTTIKDNESLERILIDAIDGTEKKRIAVQAGHFPLRFNPLTNKIGADLDIWGEFSKYSMNLGTKLARYALDKGKEVEFFIICDDQIYSEEYGAIRANNSSLAPWRKERRRFYKHFSDKGNFAESGHGLILKQNKDLDLLDKVASHSEHYNSLYFSETALKSQRGVYSTLGACTREYLHLIDNRIDKKDTYLIGFVPKRCFDRIHDALWLFKPDVQSSHIFIDTGVNTPLKAINKQYREGDIILYQQ